MPENYDMADDVKASTFMTETEVQATVASNVNDNREGDFPPPPKGGAATKAVEENTVNKDDPDISRPLSIEDIIKNKQLSPETLTEIINAAQNDNLFPTKKLNGKELTDKINELREWVDTEENRLKSIPFSIELYSQKKAVLQVRAAYVLVLECLIGEALRQIPRLNGTNSKSEGRASGQERTKSQIIKEDYGLSPRLARDFQHLTWDGVKAALELALRQNDVPTRALALSKSASIRAKQNKNNKKIKHTKFILDYMEETETKTLELEKPMYITTLFSNISIGLSRIHELNLHCRVAAEWDKTRAHWHELLYPDCHMVQGDFTSDECFNETLEWHKKQGCEIVMAILICFPYIARQIWNFVLPALYENERRFIKSIIFSSSLMFILGVIFCLIFILPLIIKFGLSFRTADIKAVLGISNVIGLSLQLAVIFGLMFQFPLITYMLIRSGITSYAAVAAKRPYIFTAILIIAAILTPPDIVSQLMLAVPTYILFELGLYCSRKFAP